MVMGNKKKTTTKKLEGKFIVATLPGNKLAPRRKLQGTGQNL